jgi:hypothetical protein
MSKPTLKTGIGVLAFFSLMCTFSWLIGINPVSAQMQYHCVTGNFPCESCATTMNSYYCDNGQPPAPLHPGACQQGAGQCTQWLSWKCGDAYDCADGTYLTPCNIYSFCSP